MPLSDAAEPARGHVSWLAGGLQLQLLCVAPAPCAQQGRACSLQDLGGRGVLLWLGLWHPAFLSLLTTLLTQNPSMADPAP